MEGLKEGGRKRRKSWTETEGEGTGLTLDSEFGKTDLVAVGRLDEEMSKSRGRGDVLGGLYSAL